MDAVSAYPDDEHDPNPAIRGHTTITGDGQIDEPSHGSRGPLSTAALRTFWTFC